MTIRRPAAAPALPRLPLLLLLTLVAAAPGVRAATVEVKGDGAALEAKGAAGAAPKADAPPGVLVVFPFASEGDGGDLGRKLADRFRLRAKRLGLVIVDRMSIRDVMAGRPMPGPETSPVEAAALLEETFGADLGLWGRVRRQGGGLVIDARGVDLRGGDVRPVGETATADSPQAVNPIQDRMLEALTGLRKRPVPRATPEADAKVPTRGPNLVANGGFEAGAVHPEGWDRIDGLTTFLDRGTSPDGRCLKMDTDVYHNQWMAWRARWKAGAAPSEAPAKRPTSGPKYDTVAGIYGVAFDSAPIPVEPGATYKLEVDFKGKSKLGGAIEFFPKLFVRGYGEVAGETRVVYDAQLALRCHTQGARWEHNVRLIEVPTDTQAPVEFVRVKLYAYWPPAVYFFDNVRFRRAAEGQAAARGSASDKVTE